MLTSTCTYVISMILRHGWVGVGCEGSTILAAYIAPSKSHVDPLAMQRLLDKPGLETVLQAMQFYVCLV